MGCNKLFAKDAPAPPAEGAGGEQAKTAEPVAEPAHADSPSAEGHDAHAARYGVPFAWEASPEEPLARARKFMAEVLNANETFMAQGRDHFTPFVDDEKPRATVLACADSRVQAGAWDSSPENDDYTVRNLGNQLATSRGSVQYGVEQLHTPVLLIVGHTGCDAVKTVMNKAVKGKDAIGDELSRMKLADRRRGGDSGEWSGLTSAVVANVDAQVAEAVAQFSPFVQSGELTVVGAVYDFANELDDGHGRLRIVNVNSNTEDERIAAFVEAVKLSEKPAARSPSFARRTPDERARALLDGSNRLQPGSPRATVNAVSVVGSGGFDAVTSGTLRAPRSTGGLVPGTSDLKLAPGANRYANVGRSPAPAEASHDGAAHGSKSHGAHGSAPALPGAAPSVHGSAPAARGSAAAGGHRKPTGTDGASPGGHADDPPPGPAAPDREAAHGETGGHESGHGTPVKRGIAIPGAAHDATPPGKRKASAAGQAEAKPHAEEKSGADHH